MADKTHKPHAIFVPYPLQGHVIPSVHLAITLASRGFTITYINTQSVHHQTYKAHPNSGPDIFSSARDSGLDIRYTTVSDGLPIGFDRSLNHDQFMASLLHVFSAHVDEALAEILRSGEKVDCLIADTFFVWPSKLASKFKLLYVSFWTEPALVFTLYYHIHLLRKNCHFGCHDCREDTIDYIPGVEAIEPTDMMSYLQETDTTSMCHQIIFSAFNDVRNADYVLCNTAQELETETLSALKAKVPIYTIGPVFPQGFTKSNLVTSMWSESDCTHWLDKKPHGSVLYISFGSYAHVTKQDLIKIAYGVSLSQVSFVWVLRPDIVSSDDTDPLPSDFKEEVGDRSMIIPWCRQIAVLAHPAIGGFLTHCGWNSILESMWCEVPLLCFPLLTDQFTNRKLVVDDWKVGINLSDRRLSSKESVSVNINRLMKGKSRDDFIKRVKEVKKTLQNASSRSGSSQQNMDNFMQHLKAKIEAKHIFACSN